MHYISFEIPKEQYRDHLVEQLTMFICMFCGHFQHCLPDLSWSIIAWGAPCRATMWCTMESEWRILDVEIVNIWSAQKFICDPYCQLDIKSSYKKRSKCNFMNLSSLLSKLPNDPPLSTLRCAPPPRCSQSPPSYWPTWRNPPDWSGWKLTCAVGERIKHCQWQTKHYSSLKISRNLILFFERFLGVKFSSCNP